GRPVQVYGASRRSTRQAGASRQAFLDLEQMPFELTKLLPAHSRASGNPGALGPTSAGTPLSRGRADRTIGAPPPPIGPPAHRFGPHRSRDSLRAEKLSLVLGHQRVDDLAQ